MSRVSVKRASDCLFGSPCDKLPQTCQSPSVFAHKRKKLEDGYENVNDDPMETRSPPRETSHFPEHVYDSNTVEQFIELPKAKKAVPVMSGPPMFTADQVKRIVEDSLRLQEAKLRQEYDCILTERLREQFENFSSFNKDYISRQLSKNDFSYLS